MVKVDYISTKDINRVAKIHSSKKYFNWIMKIIDNEYRFYPPLIIENDEDLDDFEFETDDDEDISNLDDMLDRKESLENVSMFGELWDNTTKFFTEEKFSFVNILESRVDKKMRNIKKGMNTLAKIEQYSIEDIKLKKADGKAVKKDKIVDLSLASDSYKLYRVKQNSNCLAKIDKYKDEVIDNYKVSRNQAFSAKLKRFMEKASDEIEILTWEDDYA